MYSKKESLDKFYTKPSVALECLSSLDLHEYDTIIEPSAGSGAFSSQITHPNLVAMDLLPENDTITKQDWFSYEANHEGRVLVVGNPPFGLRNKLSQAFIVKALQIADTVAFILPNVYNKHTLQSIFPKGWRLKAVTPLKKNSFTLNGADYNVPCSFFVFDKSEGDNLMFDVAKYQTCSDFTFCKKEEADIFIMGASPSTVKFLDEIKPSNRGYYLKSKIDKWELIRRIQKTEWKGNSSASGGVSWLTKPEIIKCYMESRYE